MRKLPQIAAATVLMAAILACNLPSGEQIDALATALAVAMTQTAAALPGQPTQAPPAGAPTATPVTPVPTVPPPPTACSPIVTANLNANVRYGPSTDYDTVGFLPTGGTAPLAGRNDANTWWYIVFSGGSGGHAWISQSVVTASCLPAVVAVIAAPPLPPTPTPVPVVFAVTSVSYTLSKADYNNHYYKNCPTVTASITTNKAGDVTYHFTRSDGAGSPSETLHFDSAGTQTVQDHWQLPTAAGADTRWIGIFIESPNNQDFGHKKFNFTCSAP